MLATCLGSDQAEELWRDQVQALSDRGLCQGSLQAGGGGALLGPGQYTITALPGITSSRRG